MEFGSIVYKWYFGWLVIYVVGDREGEDRSGIDYLEVFYFVGMGFFFVELWGVVWENKEFFYFSLIIVFVIKNIIRF